MLVRLSKSKTCFLSPYLSVLAAFERRLMMNCFVSTVRKFAADVVAPKVMEMDENEKMDPTIIKGLFEQGVREPFFSIRIAGAVCSRETTGMCG